MVNIKELRKLLGLSQEQLARELDVATFTIRRWEKGQMNIHPGNKRRLEKLAQKAGLL